MQHCVKRRRTRSQSADGSAERGGGGVQIWYCGGIADKATIDNCMTYDIAADAWDASSPPPMPAGRNHAATCSDGASMWVFGGRSGENVVGEGFADTQIYSGGAWSRGTPLPFGRGGMGKAVYWQGKCYVFGGEVWSEHTPIPDKANAVDALQTVYSVDIYDVATDSWSRGAVRAAACLRPFFCACRCSRRCCCCVTSAAQRGTVGAAAPRGIALAHRHALGPSGQARLC